MVWGPTVVVVLLTANVCRRTVSLGERLAEVVVAESAKKLTVPVAKGGVATESVTVAVQLVEAPAAKAGGLQLTVVTVGCLVTVTAAAVALEELSWVASPWYVATMVWGPTVVDLKSVGVGC